MTDITDEMKVAAVKAYTEVDGKCRPAAMQKALEAALPFLPIAVEGKVKALEWREDQTDDGRQQWHSNDRECITVMGRAFADHERYWLFHAQRGFPSLQEAKAAAQADYESRIRSALIPAVGDGWKWSRREEAFTDFWEQCQKLVDASDVGKARQAFMAGMDAATHFDRADADAGIEAVAAFLKVRDENVLPSETSDDEREESARCILRALSTTKPDMQEYADGIRAAAALFETDPSEPVDDLTRLRREASRQNILKLIHSPKATDIRGYQDRVYAAHHELFHDDPTDIAERLARFMEEANETCQAFGMSREDAHRLVDYTWDRPAGEPSKEIGAAMLTLTLLCVVAGYDLMQCAEADLEKLQRPETIARIRAKRSTRHGRGPLPGFDPAALAAQGDEAQEGTR